MADIDGVMTELERGLAIVLGPVPEGESRVTLETTEQGDPVISIDASMVIGSKVAYPTNTLSDIQAGDRMVAAQVLAYLLLDMSHGLMNQAELLTQVNPQMLEMELSKEE